MLFVMDIVAEDEFNIPVTCCPVALVEAVEALTLLAVEVLPMVLLFTVTVVPEVILIPTKLAETDVVEPATVTDPKVLFEMLMVPEELFAIPKLTPAVVVVLTVTEPVPVVSPIVLAVTFPILMFPATLYIPHQTPGCVDAPLDDNQLKFLITFPWTEVASVVPTLR